jgi:hypothetical protein
MNPMPSLEVNRDRIYKQYDKSKKPEYRRPTTAIVAKMARLESERLVNETVFTWLEGEPQWLGADGNHAKTHY